MISSVIRQKDEYQNGCFKKIKHAKFSKKRTFLTPWYARAYWNVPFSENLACFVFLKHPGWFYHIAQSSLIVLSIHFLKCVQIRSYFWSVFSCIRTECGDLRSKSRKIRIRNNSAIGHFSCSDSYSRFLFLEASRCAKSFLGYRTQLLSNDTLSRMSCLLLYFGRKTTVSDTCSQNQAPINRFFLQLWI